MNHNLTTLQSDLLAVVLAVLLMLGISMTGKGQYYDTLPRQEKSDSISTLYLYNLSETPRGLYETRPSFIDTYGPLIMVSPVIIILLILFGAVGHDEYKKITRNIKGRYRVDEDGNIFIKNKQYK